MLSVTTDADLPTRLAYLLKTGFAGERSANPMSPQLTYGRHRGPAPPTARAAAVLMLFFRRCGVWHLPLTIRPVAEIRHAGQICLPGGSVEGDETTEEAALRELEEELGPCPPLEFVGRMPTCYVFASDFEVTPWIAFTKEIPRWRPNPDEVFRVVEMPLTALMAAGRKDYRTIRYGALTFRAPCYRLGDDIVWGATAVMLGELARAMRLI